ncbi:MAG: hypothetical protein AAF481_18875 [Acidobacteriota bacterium]
MDYRVVLVFFVLVFSTFDASGQEASPVPSLEITRSDTGVTVTGVTPGAELALLGVGRSSSGFGPVLETWPEPLADDDGAEPGTSMQRPPSQEALSGGFLSFSEAGAERISDLLDEEEEALDQDSHESATGNPVDCTRGTVGGGRGANDCG